MVGEVSGRYLGGHPWTMGGISAHQKALGLVLVVWELMSLFYQHFVNPVIKIPGRGGGGRGREPR